MRTPDRTVAVYYEHPDWFRPLFAELERRGVPHVRWHAAEHVFDPASEAGEEHDRLLVVNRMSPSAWKRGNGAAILYTRHLLAWLEANDVPVMNGTHAFAYETSKALQIGLIESLRLRAPRTRVVNHPKALTRAARELAFPVVVKPNIGGSGAGIVRFGTEDELRAAVDEDAIGTSLDGTLLLQEYHPPRDGSIVRIETLEGRYLYAIRIHLGEGAGFDLCPAHVCRTAGGESLQSAACPAGAAQAGLTVEAAEPPREAIEAAERIARAARLDVGGIEYLESARDGHRYFYDVNALSNFVAEPVRVLGFDPMLRLVDALLARAVSAATVAPRAAAV
jgi:glutathione synthase/RimK-type ligase-like ATP-grasp enzyme